MFYPASIHTHTEFCDGRDTMETMAEAAAEAGFLTLGFSPHSPLPYGNDWAMKEDDYPAFFAKIAALKERYAGKMEVFAGLEWDSQTESLPEGLDYVIGAVHSLVKKGECFAVDYRKDLLLSVRDRLYGGDFLKLCAEYYDEVVRSALRPRVDIVAHLDLVTKYNKDGDILDENDPAYLALAQNCIDRILDARPDVFFEINTGVMMRAGKACPYPAPALLDHLVKNGARLVLTCDCHRAKLLGGGYEKARELLLSRPSAQLYIFAHGGFVRYKIS